MGQIIYKVLTRSQWVAAEQGGDVCAPVDLADGYVHFSTDQQLQATLDKWFRGEQGCVLLAYDADAFEEALRWEPARQGALFPHVYGRVRADQALAIWPLELGGHEAPQVPEDVVLSSRSRRADPLP